MSKIVNPSGRSSGGYVRMVLVLPRRFVVFEKLQQFASLDLFFGRLNKEGTASAGSGNRIDLLR